MYFLNAFERHLPIFWIWISENPNEAAVVAAPIRKLWDWYRCKSRLQKAKAVRKWCVKNCLETGNLSMKEKRGSEGDPCFLIWRYWVSAKQGQITGFFVFWCRRKVVTLDFECLKWGILISMSCKWSTPLWIEICSNRKNVVQSQLFLWFLQLVKMHKMPKWTWLLVSSGGMRKMKYAAGHLPIVSKLLALWEVANPMMVYISETLSAFS